MDPPGFVYEYGKAAQTLLEKKAVLEPNFSRGTYQFEVEEKKGSFYPFLQVKDDGELADSFCSCKLSESGRGCPHLAAAYLRLMNGTEEPLHVRFRKSLWNRLFMMASKRHGVEIDCLQKEREGAYSCDSKTKKKLFSIETEPEATSRLEGIVAKREIETEETSIKFSNLAPEELTAWREGHASHSLRYELSFWSDLAKWLMWMADEKLPYAISFLQEPGQAPTEIAIQFPGVKLWFYVAAVHWPWLIGALSAVESPLKVYDQDEETIERISYDRERCCLKVVRKEGASLPKTGEREGIALGDWLFVEGKGFYRRSSDALIEKGEVPTAEIGPFLSRSAKRLQSRFDVPVHLDPVPARYQLRFEGNDLHVQLYLFEPGDLTGGAAFFPWVYLPASGFWQLEELMFEEPDKVLEKSQVADFVNRHRHWLHQFPGFQTHFGSLEAHLTYAFNEDGALVFGAQLDFPEQFEEALDFDEWVYLKGQGFYMKKQNRGRLPLHPGLIVPRHEIGAFLALHKEDLEQVQHFFAARPPVDKMGLAIRVTEEGRIAIEPKREYVAGVDPHQVEFFGDFSYVSGQGFSELPPASRLPERYRSPMELLPYQEAAFLAYELEPLKTCTLEIDPRLSKPEELKLQIRKIVRDKKKRIAEWLVDAIYVSELGPVDIFSIWDAFQAKKSYLFSPAGLLSLKEARFNWVRQLTKRRLDRKKGLIRLNTLEWIRLSIFEDFTTPQGEAEQETRSLFAEMENFESHRLLDISLLKSTLRPYQEIGVQWLWFLYCHGLSGLLCDDMGLGKTHQAMALLAAVVHENPERTNKYLVVCPTSVIYHWQELLRRFLPELRVCTYYGLARSMENFEQDYDLLLTSYGILRTGRDDLREMSFEVAFFDEIQIAKNHASQTHKALSAISCRMRLGLTGTPIENRLRELKALFDLVLPNYLPPDAVFRDLFINPIEKSQDADKKQLLSRLIKPFILRRKKSEVLTDLPEKTEEISYCDLSDEQRALYREVALQMKSTVYNELKDASRPISYVHVFSALSSLKQICDHPSLRTGDLKNYPAHASGKWDLFVELLQEARGSAQKVVVFSQYLGMLSIIESYLKKKGIGYASIKGSTRDRSEQLRKFRDDPACEVFVASLLAAGVGIDLTAASIVIHYDRWWNPAKENQATDRVHRIGQSRGVQVFKLVTKHTIEEHIHALIEKKQGLMEDLIGQDEVDQVTYLNREELLAVFETIWKETDALPPA